MKHKDIIRKSQPVFVPEVVSLAKAAEILGLSDADLDKIIENNHLPVYCNPIQHTTNVVVRGMSFPRKKPGYECRPYLSSRLDGSSTFHKTGKTLFLNVEDVERLEDLVSHSESPPVSASPVTPDKAGSLTLVAGQIKRRVSIAGSGNTQVRQTCKENPEAVAYAKDRLKQGATPEEIAAELRKAGAGVAVIGCIMNPDYASVTQAREHGKYLLRKSN